MQELKLILRVFAIRLPLSAFSAVQHAYVERHMIFKRYFFSTLIGTIISGVVGIILAYKGVGVWALVAQYLTNTTIDIIVLCITVKWRPKLQFSCNSAKSMMSYGWKILVADLSGTFFDQLRSLIVGRVYTAADLAYYNRGNQLPGLISSNISASIMTVLFPAIANVNDDYDCVKAMTRRAVKTMAYIMFPLLFGLAAVAEPLVCLIFTDKWKDAIPFVQILSISSAIGLISPVGLQAVKAIGRSDIVLKLELYKKPMYVLLLVLGVRINVLAVAITMLVYSVYGTVINAIPLKRNLGYTFSEQVEDLRRPLILSVIMVGFVWMITKININYWAMLGLQVVSGILIYVVLSLVFKVETFQYLLSFVKEKIRK
jgi:O-antigen/teichoic acid export membrane protein